jgi:hypothetical protein
MKYERYALILKILRCLSEGFVQKRSLPCFMDYYPNIENRTSKITPSGVLADKSS